MRTAYLTAGVLVTGGLGLASEAPVERPDVPPRVVSRIAWTMPPGKPAEQIKRIIGRQKSLQEDFARKYKAAPTEAEKNRLFETDYPDPEEPAKLLHEIAGKHPADPAVFDALLWVVKYCPRPPNKPDAPFARARNALIKDFGRDPRIGELCRVLKYEQHHRPTVEFVRQVYEKHPDAAARAQAGLALASLLRRHAGFADTLKKATPKIRESWTEAYGKEYVDFLQSADPARLNKEYEAILDRLVSDKELAQVKYDQSGKARTVGEAADAELFEFRHLQPGKPAPEIVGTDIDDKPMKLSDYRGKVVLLDFWGDW